MTVAVGRPMEGVVGEASRVAHVFEVLNYPGNVTSRCGAVFWSGDVDWMDEPHGMPCEACMLVSARREVVQG